MLKSVSDVSLSRFTIVRRVEDMGSDIAYQLKVKLSNIEYYLLELDESTDIRDTAQLAVFIRAVVKDFNVAEELLHLNPLKGTTRGVDIFEGVQASLQKMGIEDFRKWVSLCTDGASSMIGCQNGLIAKVREFKPDVIAVHCIIHQEILSAKLINMDHVNSVPVYIVNYILSRGLHHREFQEFLRHLESQSEDVIYFIEVRWLSRTSTMQRFWLLFNVIIMSLKLKQKEAQELCDPLWRMDLALLNDISQKLSELNVKLKVQNKLVHYLSKHLRTFERDLQLY
ncbi:general transcription factor II-I repeat domain-containing protein 2-like [Lepeophtheirus salmonis]|uniref:general transcription factor II-I repeat domain-containing protein 2-like n=1 Tax=Lepeophtheirus salmonis TaxID=72036 RepID=UPI001AE31D1A|nr:general transcription factor II-I repeat domain-containing protein 2-like [Lepeophtheirus salmonis]